MNIRYAVVVCVTLMAVSCQPTEPQFADPGETGSQTSLAELIYGIVHGNLGRAESCSEEYAEAFAENREPFVGSLDHTLTHNLEDPLPEIIGGTLLPAVDKGDLPKLTAAVSRTTALLLDPQEEPGLETLNAAISLTQTRTVLEGDDVMSLVRRSLDDPQIVDRTHALAGLAQTHDGVDYTLDATLELVSRTLEDAGETPFECEGLELGGVEGTLLKTEGFVDDPSLGIPAWSVRSDIHGNPAVRVAEDGILYAPFIDNDGDGAADVDGSGRPVNVAGQPIDIPAFGSDGARDGQGRALGSDGQPLYAYYDAKRTALSHTIQLGRVAFEKDLHIEVLKLAEVVLGDPVVCEDGTGTCRQYPGLDHPMADLAWLLIEVGRFERALAFLDTMAVFIRENPQVGEDILVAVGEVVEAFDGPFDLSDPELLDLGAALLPLMDTLFGVSNSAGESTPRLLLDVIHDLGQTSRDFPDKLHHMVDYVALDKPRACTDSPPDLERSVAVDFEQPRFYSDGGRRVDNRSGLEQVIELLDVADCGSVPILAGGGHSVAYVVLDLIADMSPDDVCGLIDLVTSALPDLLTELGLRIIGCGGNAEAVAEALDSLDALTRSGSLDFLIPLARVFKERDQLDPLIELLRFVARDLQRDENGDPEDTSVVRRALPALSDLLATTAPDTLFDLLDLLVTVEASDGDGTLADVMVDSIARVVAEGEVSTRQGIVSDTSMALEILAPLREMVARLRVRQATGSLDSIIDHIAGYLTDTRQEGERVRLANPNLVPLLGVLLEVVQEAADLPRTDYDCYMDEFQTGSDELLTGRDFATTLRLATTLTTSAEGLVVETWLRGYLTPIPSDPEAETYGPLMQIASALLATPFVTDDLTRLLRFVGRALRENRADGRDLVAIVDGLLRSEGADSLLTMGRTMLAPRGDEPPPLTSLLDVFVDVMEVDPAQMCQVEDATPDVERLAEVLEGVVGFMDDDEHGLGAIYDLIGRRSVPSAVMDP